MNQVGSLPLIHLSLIILKKHAIVYSVLVHHFIALAPLSPLVLQSVGEKMLPNLSLVQTAIHRTSDFFYLDSHLHRECV